MSVYIHISSSYHPLRGASVLSGGQAVTIKASDKIYVNNSAYSLWLVVSGGIVSGSAYYNDVDLQDTIIVSGGTLHILGNCIASNVLLKLAGRIYVSSGGKVYAPHVMGYIYTYSGGLIDSAIVDSSSNFGYITVMPGGIVSNTTIDKGTVNIKGGQAISTTVNQGTLYVNQGALASSVVVGLGGALGVSKASAVDVIFSLGASIGTLSVLSETHISGTYMGLPCIVSSVISSGMNLPPIHFLYIGSGGTASNILINALTPYFYVLPGGTANNINVSSGVQTASFELGCTATNINIASSVFTIANVGPDTYVEGTHGSSPFLISNSIMSSCTVLPKGLIEVRSGGQANYNTVKGGLWVGAGGRAIHNSAILPSGFIKLVGGYGESNTIACYKGSTAAYLSLMASGAIAYNTSVISNGYLLIQSATAYNTSVNGGLVLVKKDGIVSNVTVSSGHLLVSSGGTAISATAFGEYSRITICSGGTGYKITNSRGGYIYFEPGAVVSG